MPTRQCQIGNYDELRVQLSGLYDNAREFPGAGLEREAVDQGIRAVYEAEQRAGTPFAVIRAKMLAFALANIRIAVADFDSFAVVCERPGEINKIQYERYNAISREKIGDALTVGRIAEESGSYISHLDLSHTVPDWDRVLTLGIPGLLALAERRFAEAPSPFTESVKIAYTAFRDFTLRFAPVARKAGRHDLAETVEFLAAHAPVTLQQALELGLLYSEVQAIEGENLRSMGIFDRMYRPFYEHDLAAGLLTKESAEELLAIYFSRFHARSHGKDAGAPFCFGGLLPNGGDGCCELTRLAWNAFRRVGEVDPKFSLRVNPETPEDVLRQVAECIRDGKNAALFINEIMARKMFLRHGKEENELANFVPIGCYEPAIMGKELSCTMTVMFNFVKGIEILMNDSAFNPESFEEVFSRYLLWVKQTLAEAMAQAIPWEKLWNEINPAPILSGTMEECMTRGLDVSQSGTKYATSGIMCAGLGSAADSLAAIRYLVFEKKRVGFGALRDILAKDWQGEERLRLEASIRAPKWGCGSECADLIGKAIVESAADEIEHTPNAKGGFYQMGLWSIDWGTRFGKRTGATPDGRHHGAVISKNTGSSIGCDTAGPAGLIESVSKLDCTRFANGTVLDVMLPPRTVTGVDGAKFICDLVRTFFLKGGFFIQFNILSPERLREAQRCPEAYRNLQIRLCGWNVRFIDLPKHEQDYLISEAESKEA